MVFLGRDQRDFRDSLIPNNPKYLSIRSSISASIPGHRVKNQGMFVDQVDIEEESCIDERAIGQIVIDAMAVNQQQYSAVEIAQADPSGAQKSIVAVIRDVEALHALQHVSQGPISKLLNVVSRDNGDRRGRFRRFLLDLGCGIDLRNVQIHQRLQRKFGQIPFWFGAILFRGGAKGERNREDWQRSAH